MTSLSRRGSAIVVGLLIGFPSIALSRDNPPRAEKVMYELDIRFETGKADIRPAYDPEVKRVAQELQNYPQATAVIEGYADHVGPETFNRDLSEKRAQSVKAYLTSHYQIAPDRLKTVGFGETKPVATNQTAEGRTRNRAVLVTVNRLITSIQDQK